ncbi:MAG: leucine-rich repeat domain-containing protein, partial [Paludibacteraceae bacterium]|nr:leucine-rich repeat domain-containing protein [Paludibacteraceae bacterium]
MRKVLSVLAALVCSTTLFAEVVKIGDLWYDLDTSNKTAEVVSNFGTVDDWEYADYSGLTNVIIPATVEYESEVYKVTYINNYAFDGCSKLTSISIGSNITGIGKSVSEGCSALTSVVWNAKHCADMDYTETPYFYGGEHNNNKRPQISS